MPERDLRNLELPFVIRNCHVLAHDDGFYYGYLVEPRHIRPMRWDAKGVARRTDGKGYTVDIHDVF
jgi:hypothetical protein